MPFDPRTLDAFEVGFKSTIGGTTTFNASAFYYDYEDYQAFVQLGANQTVINLPATAYGLEAEINSRPRRRPDAATRRLVARARTSRTSSLPGQRHGGGSRPAAGAGLLGQRAGALRVRAGRRPRLGPGGRPVHGRFLLHGAVRPGREGKGLHRPERAHRLRGPGRALGASRPSSTTSPKRNTACTRSTARCLRVSLPASTGSRGPMECGRCTASAGRTEARRVCRAVCAWRARASR